MRITLQDLDPFPLEKHRHYFETGQRVTVCQGAHTGRSGKIVTKFGDGQIQVLLDSGHHVRYSEHEIEPEDFSAYGPKISFGPAVSEKSTRVAKVDDPFSFLDADAVSSDLSKALESFAGTDGLRKALAADRVPAADRALVSYAIERIAKGAFIIDPFGEDEQFGGPHRDLAIMAEKYGGSRAGDVRTLTKADGGSFADGLIKAITEGTISADDRTEALAALRKGASESRAVLERLAAKYSDRLEKRMRPGLRVGMKVRGILAGEPGKVGTIQSIDGPLVKVRFDDGSGESMTLLSATMETLIEA